MDQVKVQAREEAMAQNALAEGGLAVIIAGADHVKGLADVAFRTKKAVDYLSVSTRTVHELSE